MIMPEITDVLYPFACWAAWREGNEYASVDLIRALSSPNLTVWVITQALLKESTLEPLLSRAH
jgi:hypothetical protein